MEGAGDQRAGAAQRLERSQVVDVAHAAGSVEPLARRQLAQGAQEFEIRAAFAKLRTKEDEEAKRETDKMVAANASEAFSPVVSRQRQPVSSQPSHSWQSPQAWPSSVSWWWPNPGGREHTAARF